MARRSVVERLGDYFGKRFRTQLEREETLEGVMERLTRKRQELEKKLTAEESDSQRRLIERKIRLLEAQWDKANTLLGAAREA